MHSPNGHAARAARLGIRSPQQVGKSRSISYRRRELLSTTVGERFDRDPCPHALRTQELVPDPMGYRTGIGEHEAVRTTYAPCVRPGGHVRESRLIPVDKSGETITVPDDQARLHADASGRTWK